MSLQDENGDTNDIESLKCIIKNQGNKISQLTFDLKLKDDIISFLEKRVKELEDLTNSDNNYPRLPGEVSIQNNKIISNDNTHPDQKNNDACNEEENMYQLMNHSSFLNQLRENSSSHYHSFVHSYYHNHDSFALSQTHSTPLLPPKMRSANGSFVSYKNNETDIEDLFDKEMEHFVETIKDTQNIDDFNCKIKISTEGKVNPQQSCKNNISDIQNKKKKKEFKRELKENNEQIKAISENTKSKVKDYIIKNPNVNNASQSPKKITFRRSKVEKETTNLPPIKKTDISQLKIQKTKKQDEKQAIRKPNDNKIHNNNHSKSKISSQIKLISTKVKNNEHKKSLAISSNKGNFSNGSKTLKKNLSQNVLENLQENILKK